MNAHIPVKSLLPAREVFRSATNIGPIADEDHYQQVVSTLEALLDEAAGDETHPAMQLVDIVGDLIEDYETENHPLPQITGVHPRLRPSMTPHRPPSSNIVAPGIFGVSELIQVMRLMRA